jgi:hypothetical protein
MGNERVMRICNLNGGFIKSWENSAFSKEYFSAKVGRNYCGEPLKNSKVRDLNSPTAYVTNTLNRDTGRRIMTSEGSLPLRKRTQRLKRCLKYFLQRLANPSCRDVRG